MDDVLGIMLVIVVVATVVMIARSLLGTKAGTGSRKSRERAEREGDYGTDGLQRAEERRNVD